MIAVVASGLVDNLTCEASGPTTHGLIVRPRRGRKQQRAIRHRRPDGLEQFDLVEDMT